MKLTNNSEIYDQYIIVRDQLDEFMEKNIPEFERFAYLDLLNFKFDNMDVYQSLNLIYFDNRICLLHNENVSDRMINLSNMVLLKKLPSFFKKYNKKIESLKDKTNQE